MDINLTAREAFELAQQIETKAMNFYLEATSVAADAISRQLFADLADMERLHVQVFGAMQSLTEALIWQPPDLPAGLSQPDIWPALAGGMIQNIDTVLPQFFSQRRTSEEILRGAMDFERDTLVLFYGLRQMMTSPAEMQRLDAITKEEMGHLLTLGSQLARLGRT
jgi:rubrerythrin